MTAEKEKGVVRVEYDAEGEVEELRLDTEKFEWLDDVPTAQKRARAPVKSKKRPVIESDDDEAEFDVDDTFPGKRSKNDNEEVDDNYVEDDDAEDDEDEDGWLVDSDDDEVSRKSTKAKVAKVPKEGSSAAKKRSAPAAAPSKAPKRATSAKTLIKALAENAVKPETWAQAAEGDEEDGATGHYSHEKLGWYMEPKDAAGKRQGEAGFNKRTLHVPEAYLMDLSPAQAQWWDIKRKNFDLLLFLKVFLLNLPDRSPARNALLMLHSYTALGATGWQVLRVVQRGCRNRRA